MRRRRAVPWRTILLLGALLLATGYVVVGYFGVPALVRRGWLPALDERLAGTLQVRAVAFDPFSLALRLKDVELSAPGGERAGRAREVVLGFRPGTLVRRGIHLRELRVDQPEVGIALTDEEPPALVRALRAGSAGHTAAGQFSVDRLYVNDASLDLKMEASGGTFHRRFEQLSFSFSDLRTAEAEGNAVSLSALSASGERFSLTGGMSLDPLASDGRIAVEGLRAQDVARWLGGRWNFELVHGLLDLAFEYRFQTGRDASLVLSAGSVRLRNLVLRPRDRDEPFATLEAATLEGLEIDPSAGRFSVGAVTLTGGRHLLERDPDGRLSLARHFALNPDGVGSAAWPFAVGSVLPALPLSQWTFAVGRLEASGQSVRWTDRSGVVPVALSLEGVRLTVEDWSTRPGARPRFNAAARLEELGGLGVEGEYDPGSGRLDAGLGFDRLPAAALAAHAPGLSPWRIEEGVVSGHLEAAAVFAGTDVSIIQLRGETRFSGLRTTGPRGAALAWDMLLLREISWDRRESGRLRAGEARLLGPELRLPAGSVEVPERWPEMEIDSFEVTDGAVLLDGWLEGGETLSTAFAGTAGDLVLGRGFGGEFSCRFQSQAGGAAAGRGVIRAQGDADAGTARTSARIEDVPLALYSTRLSRVFGRAVANGFMDIEAEMALDATRLSGVGVLTFSGLEFASADAGEAPWDAARALLENADGVWRLEVPVEADRGAAVFPPTALSHAAVRAALEEVVAQPRRALASVFGRAAPPLPVAVAFPAGRDELSAGVLPGLALYARVLEERPLLCLELAPGINPAVDGPVLHATAWEAVYEPAVAEFGSRENAIRKLYAEAFPPPVDERPGFILFRIIGLFGKASPEPAEKSMEEMLEALLDRIAPGPDDFARLAEQRGAAVREAILGGTGLTAARVRALPPADPVPESGEQTGEEVAPVVEIRVAPCPGAGGTAGPTPGP